MISKYQQRKRAYTNILMFIGVMALAMVAWLDNQNRLPDRRASAKVDNNPVSLVAFINSNGVNNELRRTEDQWTLLKPVTVVARSSRVARLLELQTLDFSQGYDADSVNLETARLDAQARLLQLDTDIYRFGTIEPVSAKRYVQLANKVLLVDDRYLPLMDGGVNAFAELQLPMQGLKAMTIEDEPLDNSRLLAWQDTQAIGVRTVDSAAPQEQTITLVAEDTQLTQWSARPDKGMWVLQQKNAAIEYLISAAQAATLGLPQQ